MKNYSRNIRLGFVKGLPLFIVIAVLNLLVTTKIYAQTDSVRWSLTSNVNPDIFGNLTAGTQTLSNMVVRSYNGGICQKSAPTTTGDWIAETVENPNRYVQFAVSPASGFNFNISSIRFFVGWAGTTGKIFANIYYSNDPTFSSRTQLGSTITLQNDVGVFTSFSLSVPVNDGSSLYVRIYPWANALLATKSCGLFDVAILGSTSGASSPSLMVNPTALAFSTIAVNTSQDIPYALSGSQLNPSSGSITVTAPTGFTISTTSGSGYSSSLTAPYSGSTLSSTTIYTRFTPTSAATYSGTITNTGGGATTQNVSVSGSGTIIIAGIFVSLTGSDSYPGTYDQPFLTIPKAISVALPGDTIFVRSGRYNLSTTITISSSGLSSNFCCLYGYPGDATRPILDFSTEAAGSRGLSLSGNYWHIKGIEVYKAGDNGLYISGSHNIIEYCSFSENKDSGLQLSGGASSNQVINCDSYYNADPPDYADADGFACKMDVGTGNYFYGCRSWQNVDDGWDGYMRGATGVSTTLENCWTWRNGYLKDGSNPGTQANGNGFKLGGSDTKDLVHNFIVKNGLSFQNKAKGFDQNSNAGSITLYNCTAYNNLDKDYMLNSTGVIYDPTSVFTVINCASLGTSGTSFRPSTILTTNNFLTSAGDYISIDTAGVRGPRNADGSLPEIAFMHLTCGTTLIDAGTNIGLPFNGPAPDLGAFESSCSGTNYTLTITASNGSVTKSPDQTSYASGTSVQLTAVPATGYHFASWSGDLTGTANPANVTMNVNKTITANFTINTYTLNVTATNGTVTKSPNLSAYDSNATVQLTAIPATGYHFMSWSGDLTGSANPATVTMNVNKNITANFAINTYTLTVSGTNGTVTKSPNLSVYDSNATVQLTAIPATGYHFMSWSGDLTGSANPANVIINANKNITANFAPNVVTTFTLTMNANPTADGTVTKSPDQASYDSASTVQLTAAPAIGYQFTGWSGDLTGTTNPVNVTMDANKNVTANFVLSAVTIPVSIVQGWNLLSVPVAQPDSTPSVVFPGHLGDIFEYDAATNSYQPALSVRVGVGYWVYYTSAQVVNITGPVVGPITLGCSAGWNLIGSREVPVNASALTTVPAGLLLGDIFRNTPTGYASTTVINSGEAVWIYVTGACMITIP